MSYIRKWNLNETTGRYAGTNIVEPVIELRLGVKLSDGTQQLVGRFRLDLNLLSGKGFRRAARRCW